MMKSAQELSPEHRKLVAMMTSDGRTTEAEALNEIAKMHRSASKTTRLTAVYCIVFSALGLLISGGGITWMLLSGRIKIVLSVVLFAILFFCLKFLLQSIKELIMGK